MIVRTFKTNQVYIFAFIPLALAILSVQQLWKEFDFSEHGQLPFVSEWMSSLLSLPVFAFILALLLITFQSFQLSKTCEENRMMPFSTNFPAFILILNYAMVGTDQLFSPAMISGVFVILALRKTLLVYNQKRIDASLFRAGIYVALAGIFYMPALLLMPVFLYHIWLSRPVNWREWVIPFIGLLTPYIYVFVYYLFIDNLQGFGNALITAAVFFTGQGRSWADLLPMIVTLMIFGAGLAFLLMTVNRRTVRINNLYKVIFILVVVGGLAAILQADDKTSFLIFLLPPISIVQAYFILGLEKNWLREGVVYLSLLLVVIKMIF